MAVTESKALTALHGIALAGDVDLIDNRGITRKARIICAEFEVSKVDIAVVELLENEDRFSVFIPVCRYPVTLAQRLYVVGLVPDLHDNTIPYYAECYVSGIEAGES